jgi:N12 class adenine-specific DNA methylase
MASLEELKNKYLKKDEDEKEKDKEKNKTPSPSSSTSGTTSNNAPKTKLDELKNKYLVSSMSGNDASKWFEESSNIMSQLSKSDMSDYAKYSQVDIEKLRSLYDSSEEARKYIRNNRDNISDYDELAKGYEQLRSGLYSIINANEYYSRWKSENQYNLWKWKEDKKAEWQQKLYEKRLKEYEEQQKAYEELLNYDLGSAQKEIEDMEYDKDIIFELSRVNVAYDRDTALANGTDEATYNDIEAKRKYISDKYGVDLYYDIYNNTNIFGELDNSISSSLKAKKIKSKLAEKTQKDYEADQKYKGYFENIDANEASQGWQKYLADEEAAKNSPKYDINNDGKDAWWETALGLLAGDGGGVVDTTLPNAGVTQTIHDLRADKSYRRPNDDWTKEQKDAFGQLYLLSPSLAYDFAEETNARNNKAKEEDALLKISEASTSGFWSRQGNTLGAIATAPLGLADYLGDLAMANAGRDIAPDGTVSPFEYSQAVTGGISSYYNDKYGTIDDDVWLIGGKGFGDIYQLNTSIAQSLASAYTLGSAGTLVAYFGQGAASGMDDALARGASEGQAALYGTALGVFEGLAESIGVDNLFKLDTSKGFIKNILKQAGAEGTEEGLTSLFSNIADNVIMQDKSNFNILVSQYMAQGMSESEAKKKAWMDSVGGIAFDTIVGAISGGVSGAFHTGANKVVNKVANTIQESQQIKAHGQAIIDNNGVDPLKELALEVSGVKQDREGKKLENLVGKVDKKTTAKNVGKLSAQMESTITKQNRAEIESALMEKGLSEKEAKVAVKDIVGGELTTAEKSMIESDHFQKAIDAVLYGSDTNVNTNSLKLAEARLGISNKATTTADSSASAEKKPSMTENPTAKEIGSEGKFEVSEAVEDNAEATAENASEITAKASKIIEEEKSTVTLADASKKFGAQAQAMVHTYTEGQDVAKYDTAYSAAYDMGRSGVALSYVMNSDSTAYLSEKQKELAYEAGAAASDTAAKEQDAKNKSLANGKTGRKIGTVKGEGVTISDLKKTFNDTQNKAYKILSTFAEATGVDIVLYKSEANAEGDFEGAQGRFKWSDDKLYIDINAGLKNIKSVDDLAKYAMLRTFSHEFTHFIEKWNPIWYNELRKAVFAELTARGENVHDLIETKMSQNKGMSYEKASREVVAEAMTDILPDSHFIETLANNHKNIFEKLLAKLKEFLSDLKAYFNSIGHNRSREANALKEQVGEAVHYVESIVELFDKAAIGAVENYQATVAIDETAETSKPKETVSEGVGEYADDYERLENAISRVTRYEIGGFLFRIYKNGDTWQGHLDQVIQSEGGYPVSDASGLHYKSEIFNDRAKAVEDLIAVARNNKLLGSIVENTNNIQEVNQNGTERQKADANERTSENGEGSHERSLHKDGNRPGISEESGGRQEVHREAEDLRGRHGVVDQSFSSNAFVEPREGSVEAAESNVLKEYGIESYVVKKSEWFKEAPAFARDGKVYMREELDEEDRGLIAPHEATHVMRQLEYKPYLDFVERTPEMLNFSSRFTQEVIDQITKHKNADAFDLDETSLLGVYDELNATVYGHIAQGLSEQFKNGLSEVFYDFNEYAREISAIHEKFKADNNKEVKPNVENVDNGSTVRQSDTDRQGDTQVLERLQAEDVSGDAPRGDSVGDSVERRQETRRDDVRDGSGAGTRSRSSDGDNQSGDIRRDDKLTPEAAEKLHEEVTEQISQQSTELPKGKNFVIGDSLDLPNGEKARYKANIEAIRLVKKLEAEGRYATEAEQVILSKYVGWGGLANAFDERKADWSKEFKELSELLTKEEYELARGSTLNAHYTDISVIKAMYDGLRQIGFDGGRMMEPSSGVGNFVGAMPSDMSAKVKSWTMVELDGITGLIAKYLYPNADVRIQGFEKANIPNNYMDVIISNVPFGNYPITDKAYPKKVTSAIHNYFFAKSLDKVRPGGIVMFITSSYTMNSKDETVRRYIMQRADLLGAIRLPDTAFKGNAGTEVVTDILILKKRSANTTYSGEDFLEAPWTRLQTESYNGAYINSYFNNHPEMVLGTATMDGSMYRGNSLTYKALEGKGSLADQIREAFKSIKGKMDYPLQLSPEKTNFAVERADKKTKADGYVAKNGKIYQNKDGELVEQTVTPKVAERIKGMLEIRDAAKALMNAQQQGQSETEVKKARTTLNKLYDAFVKKNGFLNAPSNKSAFNGDPDRYSLFALENWNPDKKTATKSDIFSKNTIAPNRTVASAKDVAEGLIVSVNQTGGVDIPLIAALTSKSVPDVTRELLDSRQAFKNRNGVLETAEKYLSGNVRAKLRDAEALVPMDSDYQKNVEALKAVIPEDVGYQDIFVNPGTPWIPSSVYSDFAAYMLGSSNSEWRQNVDVTRNPETGNFTVELKNSYLKHNASNTQKWGTSRRSFLELFDAMLNSKSVVIKDKLDDGSFVINKDATAAANEKIENITKEFQEWLWKDETRRVELATLYNETFNSIVTPKYNGDNLTVNGANAMKPLRPHQRNAVQRVISSGGNTLLAHKVGAGKTYEMAAAAMKLKELGLVKKPMFAVPKSLVAQWGTEFIDFFPTAKLLVAEATDFTTSNRKVFMNRIANGDYDAVIVSYEQFEKLPVSDDFTRELYQEQINSVIAAIEEAKAEKGAKAMSVKDLEKKRKSLQAKIDKLTDKAKDEGNIDFEELGVDSLFIDEAHNFKNLFYTTSMTNVSGLGNKDGSKRAFDLYTKVRYLQKLNGGKGIVFATATPVMNSMSEMYIMQKYLQPDLLEQLGLSTFDAWAKQFGEVVNGVEIKPSGQGYRVKQSFSRFKNMSELQLLFRNFADVLTEIPGLKIPTMKGGKVNVVVCEPGQYQQDYMKELEKRADNIKNVDPSVDNMLKITSDGRKISYTQRMIDPSLPYEEGCKIYRCADNVVKGYNDSKDIKGTQLIFCDMATPKGKSKTETSTDTDDTSMDMESARLYDDIKARLIEGGIPAKEIAFIHEADTDQKKKKLFADVNDGKVRVLIGSTGKMGVGMNAQKRVVAIHHLDAPWRPGDVEQRNGRAFRQGNINDEVECFTYVTEGSFDARLWDILERKQNFINQVMNGESVGRETEDTGEVTLSAAEVKALASGSPLIMEQVQLDTDIKKLESLYRAHRSSVRAAVERLAKDKGDIEVIERRISKGKEDVLSIKDTYSEGRFHITVGKQTYTEKKDAGAALMAEATAKAVDSGYTTIGSFAGFNVRVVKTHEGIKGLISGKQGYSFNTYPNNTTFMINHMISVVEGISEKVSMWETQLSDTKKDIVEQEKLIAEPFAKQSELDEKRKRYDEVMAILNPKEEQSLDSVAEDTVQEQSREYLGEGEQEQQRTDTLTDREVLEMAANEIKVSDLNQAEKDALTIFQDRLSKLKDLQDKRTEAGRLYKEQQFGVKVDRQAASETLNRMQILDGQIKKATADVLTVEEKEVLKRVLGKARKVVEVQERQHGQEILNRWRDRRKNAENIKKYRERLRGDVDELTNWIVGPNNKDIVKHVPDVLKNSVIPFLSSINFMSKRSLKGGNATKADEAFMDRLKKLNSALKINIDASGLYSGYNDLPPNFMERLQTFIESTEALVKKNSGELIINQMTSAELKDLSSIVRTLKKYIMQVNRFHNNAMYQHVYEAGDNSIDFLKELDNAGSHTDGLSNFLFWQQIRPAYAFERFGKGGEAIYDGLRRGQAKLAFNTREIESFTKKAYTAKEVKAWEDEIKTFTLGNDLVKIPVSHLMSFYELSKDPEAKEHIDGGGIRVATYTRNGKKLSDTGHILTVGEYNQIIGSLSDRQREVADSLQKYMAEQGGKWGNYVSVARFGEELFTNPKYFPINSDGRHLSATVEEHPSAAALYALLNMSFTKSRKEGANNRIVIYSIFDVFANHMASMAQYNAMALPVLDALKWFNYQQVFIDDEGNKTVIARVRDQMSRVYGVPEETRPGSGKQGYAETFIVNIIKAFNGTEAQGTPNDSLGLKSLHRYNVAQVAYNLRVVVQQPMAITRAGMLLDYRSIIKGMKLNPSAIKKNIEEMQKYSGIAAWKALGFYDVNISRGLTHLIKHDSTFMNKVGDVGMWGAEKADTLTWAAIWGAAKAEVTKKQHLTPESEGFYEAVTQLFEDVIYKTQVVDSILTKNEFMRDKGTFARLVGSFMSEPTTNASMLIDALDKYNLDVKRGMTKRDAWQKNGRMIGRRLYVYAVGAVLLAVVQAAADALRDDDEYKEWYEKWLEAFGGNIVDELMPFNKLPILSDFYDLAKELLSIFGVDTYGNPPQSVFMQWYDSLVKGTEIIYDKIMSEDTNYTWYGGIYKLLQAASGMSGLPMAAATREIITAWNNTVGAMAPSLKVKTYEPSELAQIRYAYEDGYLTYDEAVSLLLEKGLADNENEAYFTVEGWEAGEGYSRYDAIYDAVLNGGDISAAMDELTSHGYTEEEVLRQVKSQIGNWYYDKESTVRITKQQAINMLDKYTDMTDEEITATVNKWSSVVVTGIKYDDIDDEFMEGNITASRAIEMYVRYGSMTKEKATEKITVLEFVKQHPECEGISYSAVNGYNTYCEPLGVPANTYYEAWKYKNTLSGEVKEPMMNYINTLSLSARQKDSLYFAFGWKESRLYEAPWR